MKEKRELYRRKMEKTIYTDIIAELEEAIVLSNSGKEKESNDAVNAIKEKLEKRIYEIEKMKDGAYLINCARGKVVDEIELLNALNTGKIAGAGIDVFEEEPTKNNELINHLKQVKIDNSMILVKGSNSMHLAKIVEFLKNKLEEKK